MQEVRPLLDVVTSTLSYVLSVLEWDTASGHLRPEAMDKADGYIPGEALQNAAWELLASPRAPSR